jgi:hypothetical protein
MKISELILHLNNIRKEHGDLEVLGSAPEWEPLYDIEKDNVNYVEPSEYMRVGNNPVVLISPN